MTPDEIEAGLKVCDAAEHSSWSLDYPTESESNFIAYARTTLPKALRGLRDAQAAIEQLTPRALFGDQCIQDNYEGAMVPVSALKDLRDWIRAANGFAWAHERTCPRHDSDAPCNCGLGDFLSRPRPMIESFRAQLAELQAKADAANASEHAKDLEISRLMDSHLAWVDAGQKAGFVFSSGPDGPSMEHNSEFNAELARIAHEDQRRTEWDLVRANERIAELEGLRLEDEGRISRAQEAWRIAMDERNELALARIADAEYVVSVREAVISEGHAHKCASSWYMNSKSGIWRHRTYVIHEDCNCGRSRILAALAAPAPTGKAGE